MLMLLAGWLHRDISASSIQFEDGARENIQATLANVEHARKFPCESKCPDPKMVRLCAYNVRSNAI